MPPGWDVLLGAVVGAVLAAALGEWRARNDDRRRRDHEGAERLSTLQRERISATRLMLIQQLEHLAAVAQGDTRAIAAIEKSLVPWERANISLIGQVGLARDYQDMLADLHARVGRGLGADEVKRVTVLQARIINALDRQEERAARGEPLEAIADDSRVEIFGPEALADRLNPPGRPPSLAGRLAALRLRWLRR